MHDHLHKNIFCTVNNILKMLKMIEKSSNKLTVFYIAIVWSNLAFYNKKTTTWSNIYFCAGKIGTMLLEYAWGMVLVRKLPRQNCLWLDVVL